MIYFTDGAIGVRCTMNRLPIRGDSFRRVRYEQPPPLRADAYSNMGFLEVAPSRSGLHWCWKLEGKAIIVKQFREMPR